MQIAHHLDVLQRRFQSGLSDKNLMKNVDETHFVVNIDNGCMLGFRSDTTLKYAKVDSSENSMTVVIGISGGRRSMIETPMMIFIHTFFS